MLAHAARSKTHILAIHTGVLIGAKQRVETAAGLEHAVDQRNCSHAGDSADCHSTGYSRSSRRQRTADAAVPAVVETHASGCADGRARDRTRITRGVLIFLRHGRRGQRDRGNRGER